MTTHITYLEKSCGHLGFVRSNYPHDTISCTQCGMAEGATGPLTVSILRRAHLEEEPDKSAQKEPERWIKQQLERDAPPTILHSDTQS